MDGAADDEGVVYGIAGSLDAADRGSARIHDEGNGTGVALLKEFECDDGVFSSANGNQRPVGIVNG